MAEGDEPAFVSLPLELIRLIPIHHPKFPGLGDLDLKWIQFPALSRLGFDIGGVQYTASPFIGWYMDAEIGVRNLVDTSRYNVLPDVARAIGWESNESTFDDLPDHEILVWLSRAQAELNYAVYMSFLKAGVTCTSSLTASQSFTAFDDQHFQEKGYRLNADPYWISPPQGSVVPIWHRGAAPNYQPKPLIARNKFDPVKAWKRSHDIPINSNVQQSFGEAPEDLAISEKSRDHIFFCGTGGTASKLAEKIQSYLRQNSAHAIGDFGTLNSFNPQNISQGDTVLLIIATTGQGEIPSNGQQFMKRVWTILGGIPQIKYSIFGIGARGYQESFNGAAKTIHKVFQDKSIQPLFLNGLSESDVALENPPLASFKQWLKNVEYASSGGIVKETSELASTIYDQQYNMLRKFKEATMCFDAGEHKHGEILKVTLEIPESEYQDMGHIRLLPQNSQYNVEKVMRLLGIRDKEATITLTPRKESSQHETPYQTKRVPIREFLTNFVDLHAPLLKPPQDYDLDLSTTTNTSALEVLEHLSHSTTAWPLSQSPQTILLHSLTPLRPRYYSIASSSIKSKPRTNKETKLDVLVHITSNGRFSSQCLSEIGNEGKILYKLTPNILCLPLLDDKNGSEAIIAVGCGSGIAPIRSLLQRRLNQTQNEGKTAQGEGAERTKISLFLGFKNNSNVELFTEMAEEASKAGLLDLIYLVPSNKEKRRVQDYFLECEEVLRRKLVVEGAWVYICGNSEVATGVRERLESVMGREIWEGVCREGRVIQEVF